MLIAPKDSQSWIDSPGANDNAIGTVGMLEIAPILAQHETIRTVAFLFCNEEHTPWTSVAAAENAKARGDNIVALLNLDVIGVKSAEDTAAGKKTNVTIYTTPQGKVLAELTCEANEVYGIGLEQRVEKRAGPGENEGSFIKAGFPSAIAIIGSYPYADPNYHSEKDIPGRTDVENAAMAAQLALALILALGQDPPALGSQ